MGRRPAEDVSNGRNQAAELGPATGVSNVTTVDTCISSEQEDTSGLRLRKSTVAKNTSISPGPASHTSRSTSSTPSTTSIFLAMKKRGARAAVRVRFLTCILISVCLWAWSWLQRDDGSTNAYDGPASSAATTFQTDRDWENDSRQKPTSFDESNKNCTGTQHWAPPFRTQGRHIVDARGQRVKLASVNWYGASDIHNIPGGLDVQHRDKISALIRTLGFNSVRLPYSDEMVRRNPRIDPKLLSANADLITEAEADKDNASSLSSGPRALDVFTAVVESLTAAGLLVIVNNHITHSTWCCGANPCDSGWANDWLGGLCPITQTEEDWIVNWETIMRPLVSNPLVIGADLRNEVRGLWGTMTWDMWATAAEKASERLLRLNPDWLMVVEGVSSANDLSGVRKRPIRLSRPNRVVYSAHVYAWSGWGSLYPFSRRPYEDFVTAMRANWAYLLEEDVAPVWVGEFGTSDRPSQGDRNYWTHLIRYLEEVDASWGYWALNARKPDGNAWEGYGLLGDGWDAETVRWDYRLQDLRRLGLGCL